MCSLTSPLRSDGVTAARRARGFVVRRARELERADLADNAALVVSELVTNAVLHGGGCRGVELAAIPGGLRVEVRDHSQVPPLQGQAADEGLTGRGVRIVMALAARWGTRRESDGKVVWADITRATGGSSQPVVDDRLAVASKAGAAGEAEPRFHVELGDVPTDLLLAAKSHVDGLVREFALASAGAESGLTPGVPPQLATLLQTVVDRFADARLAVKQQALAAARVGAPTTRLALELPASAADAAEEYAAALDEVDLYCRAARLLTLETPPQHKVFRDWYIGELIVQLRAAATGATTPAPEPFERRLLRELDRLASAQRASERAARLYAVSSALASAATPEAVAGVVLNEGVAALGATGGGMLLATDAETLALPGAVGYDDAVVARLRSESPDAELPAAMALRTGEPVWLESQTERNRRFPQLVGLERTTVALCAVPLEVQGRRLGALRFSFTTARVFDEDERRFVEALATVTAQALDRAQLQQSRLGISRRLQRSLLPPRLPDIPGLDLAAIYHPFGDGLDVGGDFYDVWPIDEGRWAIAIGDAAGAGPEAAALTALVRHTLRALALTGWSPQRVVGLLNAAVLEAVTETGEDRFCTAVFGVITDDDGLCIEMAGGGHPPLLVRRADGTFERLVVGGALLGAFADAEIGHAVLRLSPGDTVVLVTDGVTEARRDGVMFEMDGVQRVLAEAPAGARAAAAALEAAVLTHTGGTLSDDMAAVVLQVRAEPEPG